MIWIWWSHFSSKAELGVSPVWINRGLSILDFLSISWHGWRAGVLLGPSEWSWITRTRYLNLKDQTWANNRLNNPKETTTQARGTRTLKFIGWSIACLISSAMSYRFLPQNGTAYGAGPGTWQWLVPSKRCWSCCCHLHLDRRRPGAQWRSLR